MKANEFIVEAEEQDIGRYDPTEDELSRLHFDDTRKPKLTLQNLNRLKKIRATKKLEQLQKEDLLQIMYGAPAGGEEEAGAEF